MVPMKSQNRSSPSYRHHGMLGPAPLLSFTFPAHMQPPAPRLNALADLSSAPHPLIRRTVQREMIARRQLTLLPLPNDILVDLILIHLCVRDILRLRLVCVRHLQSNISLIFYNLRYADYSMSSRTNQWSGSASCAPFTFHCHRSLLPFATPFLLSAALRQNIWLSVPSPRKQTGGVPCPNSIGLGDSVYTEM